MTVPGSRRNRARNATGLRAPEWHEGVPPGEEVVGVDFICKRSHPSSPEILGRFRMNTDDASEARDGKLLWMLPLGTGELPAQEEAGHTRARLLCPRCSTDWQASEEKMRAALLALWEPHRRCVVTYTV